jgi:agmatinase
MDSFDPDAPARPESGIFGLPHAPEQAAIILVPVPWDATTSYGAGTSAGPGAILAASRQVDLFDPDTGRAYEAGIAMLREPVDVALWNRRARSRAVKVIAVAGIVAGKPALEHALAEVNELSEKVNDRVRDTARHWLEAGKIVGVVGGDHSVPFGSIQAHAERHRAFGILHVDAHSDTREAYEGFAWSHASIMHNVLRDVPEVVRLVQVGIRDLCEEEHRRIMSMPDRVKVYTDADLVRARFEGQPFAATARAIVDQLPHDVYLSFDIDGLDPSLCPHTGTPVPGGLGFQEAVWLVSQIVRSGRRIIGFDLDEVAPGPEGDEWDANVGARLLYRMCVWTLCSARGPRSPRGPGRRRTPRTPRTT